MEKQKFDDEEQKSVKNSKAGKSQRNNSDELQHPYTLGYKNKYESLDIQYAQANAFKRLGNEKSDHFYMFLNFVILGLAVGAIGFGIKMFLFITSKYAW